MDKVQKNILKDLGKLVTIGLIATALQTHTGWKAQDNYLNYERPDKKEIKKLVDNFKDYNLCEKWYLSGCYLRAKKEIKE